MEENNIILEISPLERWKNTNLAKKWFNLKDTLWNSVYGAQIEERKPGTSQCRIHDKWYINYGLADVFGLSFHPKVIERSGNALKQWGTFVGASRIYQSPKLYQSLEKLIAEAVHAEEVVAFNSVTTVHCGVLPSLTRMTKCEIIIDKYAHNSLCRACEISANRGSVINQFSHNNVAEVEAILKSLNGAFPIIVIDSINSMQGDFAPIRELHRLISKYNGLLYIDDAHGTAIYGSNGGGFVSSIFTELPENILLVGSLSKGLSGNGGFLACSKEYRQFVEFSAEGYIFNGPIPPAMLSANIAAFEILLSDEYSLMRETLKEKQLQVMEAIYSAGFSIMQPESHIFTLVMSAQEATIIAKQLFDAGILVNLALFPAVPMKKGVIRITPSLLHSNSDIEKLENALTQFQQVEEHIDHREMQECF